MTRAELEALALRVEREEPSIALDAEVLIACGHPVPHETQRNWSAPIPLREYVLLCATHRGYQPTSSLDAAASLMPPGWHLGCVATDINGNMLVRLVTDDFLRAATSQSIPAKDDHAEKRARTAAALRALAMEASDDQ